MLDDGSMVRRCLTVSKYRQETVADMAMSPTKCQFQTAAQEKTGKSSEYDQCMCIQLQINQ